MLKVLAIIGLLALSLIIVGIFATGIALLLINTEINNDNLE